MSKFINTQHKLTIDSLVEGLKDRLKNPHYLFTDKKATIVDYYNINISKSTLDEASKLAYAPLGSNSPLRFNKIVDAYLFGIDKIMVNLNNDEYGLEADSIEGEAIVLPNTFIPYPDDYFSIKYLYKKVLFRVLEVTIDTLESGANFYKINYKLDQVDETIIDGQVVEEFKMIVNNIGTNYNTIIRSKEYDLIEKMEDISSILKEYFRNLFFSHKVQTFIYGKNGYVFYDPFVIEFIIRNGLLDGNDVYDYVSHQTFVNKTFSIDYNRTFFKALEERDKVDIEKCRIFANAEAINDTMSLMYYRIENYFKVNYITTDNKEYKYMMEIFSIDLIDRIKSNNYYDKDGDNKIYNIIIGFFNEANINSDDITMIENIDYQSDHNLFYLIPIIIYIIESGIKRLLK